MVNKVSYLWNRISNIHTIDLVLLGRGNSNIEKHYIILLMCSFDVNTIHNEIKEDNMDFTNLWIAFAIVFIALPAFGAWALHSDWRK